MNSLKKFAALLCAVCLLVVMALPASAANYTYRVRIFAGAQGNINGQTVWVLENLPYGSYINFDVDTVNVTNDKYYMMGIREAGKDNYPLANTTIHVTGDMDYVVAYGIKGNMVAYVINYVDTAGNTLYPSATRYGNIGDKPVVAFRYIDGYLPQAYNLTKTLSANEAENVFTFVYEEITTTGNGEGEEEEETIVEVVVGTTPDGNPFTTQVPDDPRELIDLDDPDAPLANFGGQGSGSGQGAEPGQSSGLLGGGEGSSGKVPLAAYGVKAVGVAGAAALLGLVIFLFFKKRKEDKEESK